MWDKRIRRIIIEDGYVWIEQTPTGVNGNVKSGQVVGIMKVYRGDLDIKLVSK